MLINTSEHKCFGNTIMRKSFKSDKKIKKGKTETQYNTIHPSNPATVASHDSW